MSLQLENVSVTLEHREVLHQANLTLAAGSITAVVGPNGSGKSTLLRAAYRAIKPASGQVRMAGDDIWRLSAKEAARRRAVLPQQQSAGLGFSSEEIVTMGRTPHARPLQGLQRHDYDLINAAFAEAQCTDLRHRAFSSLSGGEKQRVLLARAICQDTQLLILDEPTNHLDIAAQLSMLELLQSIIARRPERAALLALHDLNHALAYADQLLLLDQGRIVASGTPEMVLNEENMKSVFGVQSKLAQNPLTGSMCLSFAPLTSPSRGSRQKPVMAP
ncbi:putative Iron(III) transport ATP-binding protein [Renibacterium salmoninarum ATCC 33209]|uniref:Putative Iron(III) transport ATP-binding protein n=1 Tax=Renibacterium salmoninarum (strain ATCC 33209 / DSM 20767 / JCM 11484 / NBRC 15589 / NCIMB 2235) TaxID=288705 RepID=A9WSK7_RENSM|nr:ABC transporter ATP-binding protein [Renibacterium salmoninarum]ABY23795.1 putative Iron(III) transport ATP-binding protein [Renibacterium salmoninarum ATCC 33209]